MTIWKDIPGVPGYQASSDGDIRSVFTNRPLRGGVDKDGYRKLVVCPLGGARKTLRRAPMVATAFLGERPAGCVVRHKDNCRTNDAPHNLEWGTQKENIHDKERHGTAQVGERHPAAKLDITSVRAIRASTLSCSALAAAYGVAPSTISAVRTGRLWKTA